MKEYIAYKKWWIEYEAPHKVGSLYWGMDEEECFKQHIKDLGLYGLMEIIADWMDEL